MSTRQTVMLLLLSSVPAATIFAAGTAAAVPLAAPEWGVVDYGATPGGPIGDMNSHGWVMRIHNQTGASSRGWDLHYQPDTWDNLPVYAPEIPAQTFGDVQGEEVFLFGGPADVDFAYNASDRARPGVKSGIRVTVRTDIYGKVHRACAPATSDLNCEIVQPRPSDPIDIFVTDIRKPEKEMEGRQDWSFPSYGPL